ncbi:hypothetical protein D3C87_1639950 [compost metagenome]
MEEYFLVFCFGRILCGLIFRLGITAVVKAFFAFPGDAGEFYIFNFLRKQLLRFYIYHIYFLPVTAGGGYCISKVFFFLGKSSRLQGYRSIAGQFVRIQQYFRFAVNAGLDIQY